MTKTFTFLLIFSCGALTAQTDQRFKNVSPMVEARSRLAEGSLAFNPKRAFTIYLAEAKTGNAEAMHALGMLYSKGLGVERKITFAINWFSKAGQAGYTTAFYNMGMIYKDGLGVPQDFKKAVHCFNQGALKNDMHCLYSLGYMQYKGLGCKQNYQQAISSFRKGIAEGSTSSMYMLGLCFRNGYGTGINADSAKYWISRSANSGFILAKNELKTSAPENVNPVKDKNKNGKVYASSTGSASIKHSVNQKLAGSYTGYLIRYDWSGENVIGKSKLRIRLSGTDSLYTGQWDEEGLETTAFSGRLTASAFVFTDTRYARTDHYYPHKPAPFDFKDARLQLAEISGETFLAGSLQLVSKRLNEPEKPVYISLVRNPDATPPDAELNSFKVYPNPFTDLINVGFDLPSAQNVRLRIFNLTGLVVFQKSYGLEAGPQTLKLEPELIPGAYVVSLEYGKVKHSGLIIKQ